MNEKYEEQYYVVFPVYSEDAISLRPSKQTDLRGYDTEELIHNEGPIYFEMTSRSRSFKPSLRHIYMEGSFPIVSRAIYDEINELEINKTNLFPVIIKMSENKCIEDFFFFNIYDELDCIDFVKSEILDYDPYDSLHEIIHYSLKPEILGLIPEENRLIIKPEKTSDGVLFFHQKIIDVFNKYHANNIKIFKLSDYRLGDEFK